MDQTRGGSLLRAWLKEERRTQQWLAEQIENSQTNISSWILGPRPPPLDVALAIKKITGIAAEEWLQPVSKSSHRRAG